MSATDKAYFKALAQKARSLTSESKPLWGGMSAQHMIEHVVGSWRISNGRSKAPLLLSEDESARRKATLATDDPYPKNLMNPIFFNGLPPLRKPSLASAIDQLEDEMEAFFAHHDAHPNTIEMHPIYGPMVYAEWMHFQRKHMRHHWTQFGLL